MFTCGPAFFNSIQDIIHMQFEAGNGSTVFTDTGTGASIWTGSGGSTCSTATVLAGVSSLLIPGNAAYLTTPYTTANRFPPTGNWDLKFLWRPSTPPVSSYVLSVQDAGATAAGTAFVIATNGSQQLAVYLSDGTTRATVVSASAASQVAQTTTYAVIVSRRGSSITLNLNGVAAGSGTFSGTINTPVGGVYRLNCPLFGSALGVAGATYDNFFLSPA